MTNWSDSRSLLVLVAGYLSKLTFTWVQKPLGFAICVANSLEVAGIQSFVHFWVILVVGWAGIFVLWLNSARDVDGFSFHGH